MAKMIDKLTPLARKSARARVSCLTIPFDLGVVYLQAEAGVAAWRCAPASRMKGAASGGTLASLMKPSRPEARARAPPGEANLPALTPGSEGRRQPLTTRPASTTGPMPGAALPDGQLPTTAEHPP
jgi:hypothetical protein